MLGPESTLVMGERASDGAEAGPSSGLGESVLRCEVLRVEFVEVVTSESKTGGGLRLPEDAAGNLKLCEGELGVLFARKVVFGIVACSEGRLTGPTSSERSPCASEPAGGGEEPSGDGCAVERYPPVTPSQSACIRACCARFVTNMNANYRLVFAASPAYWRNAYGPV